MVSRNIQSSNTHATFFVNMSFVYPIVKIEVITVCNHFGLFN